MAFLFERTITKVGNIPLDLTVREEHGAEVELTENPIESGAEVADHAIDQPEMLTLEGWITDTPDVGGFDGRALFTFRRLEALTRRHELVDAITASKRYRRMMLLSLRMPVGLDTRGGRRFLLFLRQVLVSEVDEIANLSALFSDSGMGEADLGAQGVI